MAAASSQVALLRGVNLGNRRIPMKDLAAIFEGIDCESLQCANRDSRDEPENCALRTQCLVSDFRYQKEE